MKPRILDLYCGAGGAAMGYHRAGFDIVGVDIRPQPRYPFEFHQADALEFLAEHGHEFDAIHASPTCQTRAAVTAWRGSRQNHPDTLTPTLEALRRLCAPWVVENVPEAALDGTLRPDLFLCGTMFGLRIQRHRVFELSWHPLQFTQPCGSHAKVLPFLHKDERAFADAMGCTWMSKASARQAIPPAYTEYIGVQLLAPSRGSCGMTGTWTCQHGCGATATTMAGIQTHESSCSSKPKPPPRTAPPRPQPR